MLQTRVHCSHVASYWCAPMRKDKTFEMDTKGYARIIPDRIGSLVDSLDQKVIGNMQGCVSVNPFSQQHFSLKTSPGNGSKCMVANTQKPKGLSPASSTSEFTTLSPHWRWPLRKSKVKRFILRNPKLESQTRLRPLKELRKL